MKRAKRPRKRWSPGYIMMASLPTAPPLSLSSECFRIIVRDLVMISGDEKSDNNPSLNTTGRRCDICRLEYYYWRVCRGENTPETLIPLEGGRLLVNLTLKLVYTTYVDSPPR